jgi:hypothetical protein
MTCFVFPTPFARLRVVRELPGRFSWLPLRQRPVSQDSLAMVAVEKRARPSRTDLTPCTRAGREGRPPVVWSVGRPVGMMRSHGTIVIIEIQRGAPATYLLLPTYCCRGDTAAAPGAQARSDWYRSTRVLKQGL